MALAAAVAIGGPIWALRHTNALTALALSLGGLGLGIAIMAALVGWRIVLRGESIEIHKFTGNYTLARNEIRGWRSAGSQIVFELREQGRRDVTLTEGFFRPDAAFWEWMAKVPCFAKRANSLAESREAIANDSAFGANRTERLEALARAARFAKIMNVAPLAPIALLALNPRPYPAIATLWVVFPWLAIISVMAWGGLLSLDRNPRDARPGLAGGVWIAICALLIMSAGVVKVVRIADALLPAAIAGLLLFAASLLADERLWKASATAGYLLFCSLYGYGAAIQANVLLDRSRPAHFTATVLSKQIIRGKSTSYQLRLAPWGPRDKASGVAVDRPFYNSVRAGSEVCIQMRDGALGIRWFTVAACNNQ